MEIEEIHKIATNTSLSSSQYEEYLQIDLGVNAVILKALDNTLLRKLLGLVNNHSRRVRSFTEAISKPREANIIRMNNEEHLTIIRALIDGDSEMTKEAVQQHLHNVENRTTDAIKSSYDKVQNRAKGG